MKKNSFLKNSVDEALIVDNDWKSLDELFDYLNAKKEEDKEYVVNFCETLHNELKSHWFSDGLKRDLLEQYGVKCFNDSVDAFKQHYQNRRHYVTGLIAETGSVTEAVMQEFRENYWWDSWHKTDDLSQAWKELGFLKDRSSEAEKYTTKEIETALDNGARTILAIAQCKASENCAQQIDEFVERPPFSKKEIEVQFDVATKLANNFISCDELEPGKKIAFDLSASSLFLYKIQELSKDDLKEYLKSDRCPDSQSLLKLAGLLKQLSKATKQVSLLQPEEKNLFSDIDPELKKNKEFQIVASAFMSVIPLSDNEKLLFKAFKKPEIFNSLSLQVQSIREQLQKTVSFPGRSADDKTKENKFINRSLILHVAQQFSQNFLFEKAGISHDRINKIEHEVALKQKEAFQAWFFRTNEIHRAHHAEPPAKHSGIER